MPRIGYQIGKAAVGSSELAVREAASECVASLSYDIEREQVNCTFQKRGTYTYFNVSPDVFAEWNNASSRGTYFNLYIRGRYEYDRLSY
jgi:hypothetical protein